MADDRDRREGAGSRGAPKGHPDEPEPAPRGRFSRLGEQLTGLLDPEAAFRRGQGIVTGVTQATKDEVIRLVSAEVKNFLDKMDAADLLQQVIAGLVVDVNLQIRFSREDGTPRIAKSDAPSAPEGRGDKPRSNGRANAERNGDDEQDDDD